MPSAVPPLSPPPPPLSSHPSNPRFVLPMELPTAAEKEITLLSRVAANHLFLGQFEALRATLITLRRRDPELALSILRTIVAEGGRIDGVLWSSTCRSPPHLAWLSTLELAGYGADPRPVRLKVEFLLLIQLVASKVSESLEHRARDENLDDKGEIPSTDESALQTLNKILDLGYRRLKSDMDGDLLVVDEIPVLCDDELKCLWRVFLDHPDIFEAICENIQGQFQLQEPWGSEMEITARNQGMGVVSSSNKCVDALVAVQWNVQLAHLDALKESARADGLCDAFSHLRFLHLEYGLEVTMYKASVRELVSEAWSQKSYSPDLWPESQLNMMLMYVDALSSNCSQLVKMIQVIQDEVLSDKIEHHKSSNANWIPLPVKKFLETLVREKAYSSGSRSPSNDAIRSCMRDLYHYSRVTGGHALELVIKTALGAIEREQLQDASDVLSLFPLLQPLVAVLGWDILIRKTALRRKLMWLFWTSKSQSLRLEEYPHYGKQTDEQSHEEYLCDLLCFHLDLACFVASVNSGQSWNSRKSLFFSQKEQSSNGEDAELLDPFVENLILERLAVQTPVKVLFDVVPGVKYKDAFNIISMQPTASTTATWKRMQDIELIHMHYALESAVFALGVMEKCVGDDYEHLFRVALSYLRDMQSHMEAISNASRKIFMVSIVSSLLHMGDLSVNLTQTSLSECNSNPCQWFDQYISSEGSNKMVISFVALLLDILRHNLPASDSELERVVSTGVTTAGQQALKWRFSSAKYFIEDWGWRLSVLQRLQPASEHQWKWKEALDILCAAPSKLLNLCMQRAKYDIGEEAVLRFSLPPEDKAALELAEWVAGASRTVSVDDTVSRVVEDTPTSVELDISSFRDRLGPIATILLCIDVAATTARSRDMCRLLLEQGRSLLSEIFPGSSPKIGSAYWDQIQEVAIISVTRRVLQCLHDLLELEAAPTLQEVFCEGMAVSSSTEPNRLGQKQRALVLLHQMIDDAFKGKRQFLSGKLHNLARAVADEDPGSDYFKEGASYDKKDCVVLGRGLRIVKPVTKPASKAAPLGLSASESNSETIDSVNRFFGPVNSKPSTYLSNFIIYIATIGDIVDGIDTTHDFNFFSLVYEWPKDVLTRLVFERGSIDAAGKVADIMGVDFVHEVISACVPPVFPPQSCHGWACIPVLPTIATVGFENKTLLAMSNSCPPPSVTLQKTLYPLQLEIVKHLGKLSPVRAVLACVFGSSILSGDSESSLSSTDDALVQGPEVERSFYEFALEQSERYSTLNRWIQMQSNLHRVSESSVAAKSNEVAAVGLREKISLKRIREPESDDEVGVGDSAFGSFVTSTAPAYHAVDDFKVEPSVYVSFDWENEEPYEKAVERLVNEGKLMDALAVSDRCLRDGASDQLLQLLIERGEENNTVTGLPIYGPRNFGSTTWQYCLRLRDKQLAAQLALKYLRGWDLDAAIDVLSMCICHLPENDQVRGEAIQLRQALLRYGHILSADDHYSHWQEVEADCKNDPEGVALRLAAKGAVPSALEVAESASLSIELRRELQGRQLVKLLTTDPLSGGGPAEASRFLSSLRDSDDALPVAIGAMQLLPDLRSKQLLVHFCLKRTVGSLSDAEIARLNKWALGLRVLALLPLPSQQRCSTLHEHPRLILEVLLMMKQLQSASLILKELPSLRDDNLIISYAKKAIVVNVNAAPRESRISISGSRAKQKRPSMPPKSNFVQSIGNLQKEARRAFSWAPRDTGTSTTTKDVIRKRKISGLAPSERASWEAMATIQEERVSTHLPDGPERLPFVPIAEEWVLTGDPNKDDAIRVSHRYETSPDITLFKALLSLCSDESVAARGALELCIFQMEIVLSSQHLPLNASMDTMARAYHATEIYVQALGYAKSQLRKLSGSNDSSTSTERSKDADDASGDTGSSSTGSQHQDELSDLLSQADLWLGRAELLQSLLGSGIIASLDDIADKESSARLRDRLITDERYSMAVYTSKKCKIDAFPVWNAWGHALLRTEHYAQARVKFKQALQLYKADFSSVVLEIINSIEGGPPVDVSVVRSMYEHLAKSAATILDDSLSADAYLNVLYMPSTFPRSERSRQSREATDSSFVSTRSDFEDGPRSNLDNVRYAECIYYLQEYDRPQMLAFMFRHGHYGAACSLFFQSRQPSQQGEASLSSMQRVDPLATDYGTIDDLCDLCVGHGAMAVLSDTIAAASQSSMTQDVALNQYITAVLTRICNYCEAHRHFNYLYDFLVLKGDHGTAGLCCIQLFLNSQTQEDALKHLERAKAHFEEALSTRDKAVGSTKLLPKTIRLKSASEKLSKETILKFLTRIPYQMDVVKALNSADGPQWKTSLFGNPSDPETFRRRCVVAETLAEKHFDLAFRVIYGFDLPAVDIYAGVAASLAERKKGGQLTEFLKNIKGTIEADDWDQVLGAAINVYANNHKERPDRLIDMLISSHRKVLACVVCGRLKSAFQIASRSGSVADVQYVAHQALHANALPVLDMCKQWLAQYM